MKTTVDGSGLCEEDTLHRSKREIVKLENFLKVESTPSFSSTTLQLWPVTSKREKVGKRRFFRGGSIN